jgi:hypothetical protein
VMVFFLKNVKTDSSKAGVIVGGGLLRSRSLL